MAEDLSASECQSRIDQFVQVTNTDEALAQFFLQDRNWDVASSIAAFFEKDNSPRANSSSKRPHELSESNEIHSSKKTKLDAAELSISNELKAFIMEQLNSNPIIVPDKLSFISWNIDGLDERNLEKRTKDVVKTIQLRKVDIVFLQEVVSISYGILKSKLSTDYWFTDEKEFYFTTVLVKKSTLNVKNVDVKPFNNTSMCRDLTTVKALLHNGTRLVLINTHLESTKEHAEPRMLQLKTAFEFVRRQDKSASVILAGDMNARDTEVAKVGIPDGVEDLWVALGKRKECQYTWDTMRNTNLQMSGKFKPRCRFDRVYFRTSTDKEITAEHFGLCGIEKVPGMQCFPSDHWGIYCIFDIKTNNKL